MLGWRGRFPAWVCRGYSSTVGTLEIKPWEFKYCSLIGAFLRRKCIEKDLTFFPQRSVEATLVRVKICDPSTCRQDCQYLVSHLSLCTVSTGNCSPFPQQQEGLSSLQEFPSHFFCSYDLRWNLHVFYPHNLSWGKKQQNDTILDCCSSWECSVLCAACPGCSFLVDRFQETESLGLRSEALLPYPVRALNFHKFSVEVGRACCVKSHVLLRCIFTKSHLTDVEMLKLPWIGDWLIVLRC